MSYPQPVVVSAEVLEARKARSRELVRMALYAIILRFFIAGFELIGYLYFHSAALLLDAMSTFFDVFSSLFLIFSIKLAERPPDKEHPFGHGRYEPLAGLLLGIFLIFGGVAMFFHESWNVLHLEDKAPINGYVWLLPLAACVLLEWMFRRLYGISKRESSSALSAEAWHFRIDSLNSFLALIALICASIFPSYSHLCDRFGSISISLFMIGVGLYAAKTNLNQVLDRIPDEKFFERVRTAAKSVAGVMETEKIRIQQYGPDAHVDIDVEVDPQLSVDKAHSISQEVRVAIQTAWPQVREVVVHIEPYYESDHEVR